MVCEFSQVDKLDVADMRWGVVKNKGFRSQWV